MLDILVETSPQSDSKSAGIVAWHSLKDQTRSGHSWSKDSTWYIFDRVTMVMGISCIQVWQLLKAPFFSARLTWHHPKRNLSSRCDTWFTEYTSLLFNTFDILKWYLQPIDLLGDFWCMHSTGVIILPTQTMHYYRENPSRIPYICIVLIPLKLVN